MGALGNLDHERFCQAAHKRIWAGEKHASAFVAAYREAIYRGDPDADDKALEANVRRLRNTKPVKARLAELADYAAKLAGIDAAWGMVQLRGFVEGNLADYMTPAGSARFFDLTNTPRDKMAVLAEVSQEEETEVDDDGDVTRVRKVRLKLHDRIAAIGLMAKIGGWEAPKKIAPTNEDGDGPAKIIHEVAWKQPAQDQAA